MYCNQLYIYQLMKFITGKKVVFLRGERFEIEINIVQ